MKRGRLFFALIVGVLLLLTACAPVEEQKSPSVEEAQAEETTEDVLEEVPAEALVEAGEEALDSVTVQITSSGFSPQEITVKKGGIVTWVNEDTVEHWPASAMHPTHTVYPTTGGCIGSTFDVCAAMGPDESWSFTFDEAGSWKYHDHLNPGTTGTVTVTE